MSLIDVLRYRLRVLSRPRDHARETAEELEFHVDLEAMQQTHRSGDRLSPHDARFAARRRFGNSTYYREETRRVSGLAFFDTLQQDVRFAVRTLSRARTFTVVAVLTLAIGIGANTAIFSAVDALLLRPLPFRDANRLMSVALTRPLPDKPNEENKVAWSYPKFALFQQSQRSFSSVTVWREQLFTVRATDEGVRVSGECINATYLPTLGITPALGRNFTPEEDRPGTGARVVILSDELWRSMYSADPAILGRTLDVDGTPLVVIGIMPAGFEGLSGDAVFWVPISSLPADWGWSNPNNHSFFGAGRLAPGVSEQQAAAEVRGLGARIDAMYPDHDARMHWSADSRSLQSVRIDPNVRRTLLVLLGAVGVVLLIACANVANLFLVRASGRRREIAVRLAIGAARRRLVRQLLVESMMLSLLGGAASVVVAWLGVKGLGVLQPAFALDAGNAGIGPSAFGPIVLNLSALAFAAALTITTGIVFGLVPALQSTRPSLTEVLKDDGAVRSRRFRRVSSRNVLTVAEIALAVVLLAGAGLLTHSLAMLMAVRPGFDADHVLTLRINRAPAWKRDSLTTFYDHAITELAAQPGVVSVGIADTPPADGGYSASTVEIPGYPVPQIAGGGPLRAAIHYITPEWTSLMHVPLRSGRMFTRADLPASRKVVLINETAAREFWPGQDPVGRPLRVYESRIDNDTVYVIGVLPDVRFAGFRAKPVPDIFLSYYQVPFSFRMMVFVRTRGDPRAFIATARETLRHAALGFPVYDVKTMDERVSGIVAAERFSALLLSLFAGVALVLAMIGTYGVISFSVAQRTREIGVRVALGATRENVVRLIVGQGLALASLGVASGLVTAALTTRVLKSMLFGVETTDPATLVGIVGVLLFAVLLASWIPARRAAGVPAVQALRGD